MGHQGTFCVSSGRLYFFMEGKSRPTATLYELLCLNVERYALLLISYIW